MRTASQRITAYNLRFVSSQIDPTIAAKNQLQKDNFETYANDFVALQSLVHQYLDGQGVMPAEFFNYGAFAGEVYHTANHFSGATAVGNVTDLILKYKGMGCTEVRLKGIALVFGIVVP